MSSGYFTKIHKYSKQISLYLVIPTKEESHQVTPQRMSKACCYHQGREEGVILIIHHPILSLRGTKQSH